MASKHCVPVLHGVMQVELASMHYEGLQWHHYAAQAEQLLIKRNAHASQ